MTGYWLTVTEVAAEVSRTVILATGVDYRHLTPEQDPLARVLYGAPAASHEECRDKPVVVIGGGNSAGQAALNLARIGAHVALLARRPLGHTMSSYLVTRLAVDPNILLYLGETDHITQDYVYTSREDKLALPAFRVFAYVGMEPRTEFIRQCCTLVPPDNGYVQTGTDFVAHPSGLFVAGDVRAGSFKRVAAAVGEGAIAASKAWAFIYNRKD